MSFSDNEVLYFVDVLNLEGHERIDCACLSPQPCHQTPKGFNWEQKVRSTPPQLLHADVEVCSFLRAEREAVERDCLLAEEQHAERLSDLNSRLRSAAEVTEDQASPRHHR